MPPVRVLLLTSLSSFDIRPFAILYWGVQDSNLRRHCHQIYSLTPLTARETPLHFTTANYIGTLPIAGAKPRVRGSNILSPKFSITELAEGLEPTTC